MFLKFVMMLILILFLINETVNVAINENEKVNSEYEIGEMNRYHKYKLDENYHLHRLHSSNAANFFLEGCTNLYTDLGSNNSSDLQRTFPLDNPDKVLIFAIFTLHEFSILLHLDNPYENPPNPNYINLTLGVDRNRNASISSTGSNNSFVNDIRKIPSMPYYFSINLTNSGEVQVFEIRTGIRTTTHVPFFKYKYTDKEKPSKPKFFRIDHIGPIHAHYGCCELHCSRQLFHRISGCNKYSTGIVNAKRRFDLKYYSIVDVREETESTLTFNGNFFIDRPTKAAFAVKFRFYDFNKQGDFYDIVLTDTQTTIYHHISSEKRTENVTLSFKIEKVTPVTINVTITESGRVSLTQTYDTKPFMTYKSKITNKDRVKVKQMSMTKLYDDGRRYDFYYNCSDILTYFNETPRLPHTEIFSKTVHRWNETRYDLLQIFNQTFDMNEKFEMYYTREYLELVDDIEFINDVPVLTMNSESSSGYIQKALTGACSFLFVGILKFLSSLECVKNMTKELDEEKPKEYKTMANKSLRSVLKYFEEDDSD